MTNGLGPQLSLFGASVETASEADGCHIVAVGKRRDGGTRYWCLAHKADATAKYGRPAKACRAANIPPIALEEMLTLDIEAYPGGVALWGAVPPVYDTTSLPLDRGIHVHARKVPGGGKVIDKTFRAVRLTGGKIPREGLIISELDAIYYMASIVFGFEVRDVVCSLCGYSHLDKDWFSVHPHRRHLCAGCGNYFRDTVSAIGNPIRQVQQACGVSARRPKKPERVISIRQNDYSGGIQIWGSNPAIVWTAQDDEEEGIHVHAFARNDGEATVDETFSEVLIDGVSLDPLIVRTLMAQNALPHISGRVVSLTCPTCGNSEFSAGEQAFTPADSRRCSECGDHLRGSGRLRKTIANPLIAIFERLASNAPRPPQKHSIGLLPETL